MWGRGWNRANPGMVPAWGKSSNNRGLVSGNILCRTHVGLPWAAARAAVAREGIATTVVAVGGGTAVAAAATGPGLDPRTRGGEEQRTRGLKMCPLRVFTMDGLEKERRGWEGERMGWLGVKMKGGGGV